MAAGDHTVWAQASEWLSRALAVVLVMIAPGFLGSWLDEWLGTTILMPLGFVLGVVGGTTGLLVIARKLSDQAERRKSSREGDDGEDGAG